MQHVIIRMGRLTDITMIHHKTARVGYGGTKIDV